MHKTNNRSMKGSDIGGNNNNAYIARLRRLKIQEGILSSNVNKTYDECQEIYDGNYKYSTDKNLKIYLGKLKDSYIDMKNLFEDIKHKTNFQDKTLVIDIDDLKKDILELEQKIKSFKQFLRTELNSIQAEERTLVDKINKTHLQEITAEKLKSKKKTYKEIVPSPVRFMIKCPFKCVEVHHFQEFMKASPNRYGGWNEYNHNLFVQIWNKYNGNEVFTSKPIGDSHLFQEFIDEVFQKISCARFEDIHSHIEWYSQYLNLKVSQKKALDKWKENKIKIKKPLRDPNKYKSTSHPVSVIESASDNKGSKLISSHRLARISSDIECDKINSPSKSEVSKLMQPTKQWMSRCDSAKEITSSECDIQNVSKLRVPTWRLSLGSMDKTK